MTAMDGTWVPSELSRRGAEFIRARLLTGADGGESIELTRWYARSDLPAQVVARRLRYKPGYRIEVEQGWAVAILHVRAVVPDSRADCVEVGQQGILTGLRPSIGITFSRLIPAEVMDSVERDGDVAVFVQWVREVALREMELHERDEWLRLDGELVYDPHDPANLAT